MPAALAPAAFDAFMMGMQEQGLSPCRPTALFPNFPGTLLQPPHWPPPTMAPYTSELPQLPQLDAAGVGMGGAPWSWVQHSDGSLPCGLSAASEAELRAAEPEAYED